MEIQVVYSGLFSLLTNTYMEAVSLNEGSTVQDLLDKVLEMHPDVEELLLRDGILNPLCRVLVNGRDIQHLNGLDTVLKDGDRVFLQSPAGG